MAFYCMKIKSYRISNLPRILNKDYTFKRYNLQVTTIVYKHNLLITISQNI